MRHWIVWNSRAIITGLAVSVGMAAVLFLFWAMAESNADMHREQKKQDQFEGACIALEATAQGDVCVKGDKVVLTRKEFESK